MVIFIYCIYEKQNLLDSSKHDIQLKFSLGYSN